MRRQRYTLPEALIFPPSPDLSHLSPESQQILRLMKYRQWVIDLQIEPGDKVQLTGRAICLGQELLLVATMGIGEFNHIDGAANSAIRLDKCFEKVVLSLLADEDFVSLGGEAFVEIYSDLEDK